jgi:hypothetical protein
MQVIGDDSMSVVRKIESQKTDGRDRPEQEVGIAPGWWLRPPCLPIHSPLPFIPEVHLAAYPAHVT